VFKKLEGQVAGLIMEPAMMNINIIQPVEGYLQRVRELCTEHGIKLIFDEVKTGATIAPGGATERFGVTPDMVTLAKAICGGYPGGAIGMNDEIGAAVADNTVVQYGTFNGNPMVMAAAEATLTEVLTADAYEKLESSNQWLLNRCDEIIAEYGLPCYTSGLGAKGCVVFSAEPLREYRDYLTKVDGELSTLAWLYHMNNGVFMTPGVEEEWTVSVAHTEDDLKVFADALEAFARDVTA
jgi:glutamate-1-semialdehyde 2,1-aminomutase